MPWQLLYTSAPAGLVPGRSGFCTVARHRAIPERLVAAVERISVYEPTAERIPIFTYRLLALGDEHYGILSRYGDAGLDYTSRRNYLAHHLIFSAEEMRHAPPPAEIARRWTGWKTSWSEQSRWLDDPVQLSPEFLRPETRLPARNWQQLTRDAGHAAVLCPNGTAIDTVLRRSAFDDTSLLNLLAEASLLARNGPFSVGFTTCIQNTDTAAQIPWRFAIGNTGLAIEQLPPPPDTPAVRHARTGISPEHQPRAAASPLLSPARRTPAHPLPEPAGRKIDTTGTPAPKLWIIGGVAVGLALASLAGIAVWLGTPDDEAPPPVKKPLPTHAISPTPPAHSGEKNISDIYAINNLRRDLDAAIASHQWPRATELWLQMKQEHPEEFSKLPSGHILQIRQQLPLALAEELTGQFRLLEPKFSPEAVATVAEKMLAAQARLAEIDITPTPEKTPELLRLTAQLQLLQSLPQQPPEWAFLQWEPTKNPGEQTTVIDSKKLRQFLQKKHSSLQLVFSPFSQWAVRSDIVEPIRLVAPAGAYTPGKSLFLSPAPNTAPRLQFILASRSDSVRFTRTLPQNPAPLETWLNEGKSLQVTFADTQSATSFTLLLAHPDAPPAPLPAAFSLLEQSPDSLALPSWLRSALQPFIGRQSLLILHPANAHLKTSDAPGAAISRTALQTILQNNLALLRNQQDAFEKEIRELEKRRISADQVDKIDARLSELRAEIALLETRRKTFSSRISAAQNRTTPLNRLEEIWQASIFDNRTGYLLPLLRFER